MHLWLNIFWIVILLYSTNKVWWCCLVGVFCIVNGSQWYPLPLISIWFGCAVFNSRCDPILPYTMPLPPTSYHKWITLPATLAHMDQTIHVFDYFLQVAAVFISLYVCVYNALTKQHLNMYRVLRRMHISLIPKRTCCVRNLPWYRSIQPQASLTL